MAGLHMFVGCVCGRWGTPEFKAVESGPAGFITAGGAVTIVH